MIARAAWLRLRQNVGMLAALAGLLLVTAVMDVAMSTWTDGMPPFTLFLAAFTGLALAVGMLDTTLTDRHLELVERFPTPRGTAWMIDALAGIVALPVLVATASLALAAAIALDPRPPEPWSLPGSSADIALTLIGAATLSFGVGTLASGTAREAFRQIAAATLMSIGGAIGGLILLASWDMNPGLRHLAIPAVVTGLLLAACGLGMRCLAAPHLATRPRMVAANAGAWTLGALAATTVLTTAALTWRTLPRDPEVDAINIAALLDGSPQRAYLEVQASPSGRHDVLVEVERPGTWKDIGRQMNPGNADAANPMRRLFHPARLPHALARLSGDWIASGTDDAQGFELLVNLDHRVNGRWRSGSAWSWSPDGAFFAGGAFEIDRLGRFENPHAVVRARDGRVLRDVDPAGDARPIAFLTSRGFELGPLERGSREDLVVDVVFDPVTQDELRVERPRLSLARDEASSRWLFERSEVEGDLRCPTLVLRDAFAGTERVVLGRDVIGCFPVVAAPHGDSEHEHEQRAWFTAAHEASPAEAPCVVTDEELTRAAVLLPTVDGPWITLRLLALDLGSGELRTLLAADALPRESMFESNRQGRRPGLRDLTPEGLVVWQQDAGLDVTDGLTGETRPLVRWPADVLAERNTPSLRVSPRATTCLTRRDITEPEPPRRTTWLLEAWSDGMPRRLLESEDDIHDLRFLDEQRALVVNGDRVLLVPLDGSPPQVLFP